jgi:hypothetical protein
MKSKATTGAEIVNEAHDLITGPRQNDYDHPMTDYQRTADIYNALTGKQSMTPEAAVMFMVAMKLSRLMSEMQRGLDIPDNTRDAIGYLGCLNMIRTLRKGGK